MDDRPPIQAPVAPAPALFLQRRPYRRRRLIDAVRVLPIFAAFLLLVPAVLIPPGTPGSTGAMLLYLFGIWAVVIVLAALATRFLARAEMTAAGADAGGDSGPDDPFGAERD